MTSLTSNHSTGQLASISITQLKNIFKMLSEETRIRILSLLENTELKVSEIQEVLNIKQSTLSAHLNLLKEYSLVTARKEGKNVFYLTTPPRQLKSEKEIVKSTLEIARLSKWHEGDQKKLKKKLEERKITTIHFFDNDLSSLKNPIHSFQVWAKGFLALIHNKRIIDLGCGDGQLLTHLIEVDRKNEIYGLDASSKQLQLARKKLKSINPKKKINLICGDMENTGLPNRSFDLAIISHALHHASNPSKVIREISRILANEGELLIFDLNQHENMDVQKKYGDFWMGFNHISLKSWLEQAGFKILTYQIISESFFKKIKPIVVLGKVQKPAELEKESYSNSKIP